MPVIRIIGIPKPTMPLTKPESNAIMLIKISIFGELRLSVSFIF
jgi:hypothetical protein